MYVSVTARAGVRGNENSEVKITEWWYLTGELFASGVIVMPQIIRTFLTMYICWHVFIGWELGDGWGGLIYEALQHRGGNTSWGVFSVDFCTYWCISSRWCPSSTIGFPYHAFKWLQSKLYISDSLFENSMCSTKVRLILHQSLNEIVCAGVGDFLANLGSSIVAWRSIDGGE